MGAEGGGEGLAEEDVAVLAALALTDEDLAVLQIHVGNLDGAQIPFYQPAGKGGKLLFPPDAIERAAQGTSSPAVEDPPGAAECPSRLSGPCPAWMKASTLSHENPHHAP
jgi:hypothetical protein